MSPKPFTLFPSSSPSLPTYTSSQHLPPLISWIAGRTGKSGFPFTKGEYKKRKEFLRKRWERWERSGGYWGRIWGVRKSNRGKGEGKKGEEATIVGAVAANGNGNVAEAVPAPPAGAVVKPEEGLEVVGGGGSVDGTGTGAGAGRAEG
ncbi:MAG: hypothetical protein M1834_005455 [Cirrosporium novae-zelandiae]|nr:MAG: hypothetical protein M1834_005455 [Cirrosporium novae-zelandiae]